MGFRRRHFWASTVISASACGAILDGGPTFEILTAGSVPPFSINLRFGPWEGFFSVLRQCRRCCSAPGTFGRRLRASYPALLLYLILIMGINGMVMTRDLFNQLRVPGDRVDRDLWASRA